MERQIYLSVSFLVIFFVGFRCYSSKTIMDYSITHCEDKVFKISSIFEKGEDNSSEIAKLEKDIKNWSDPYGCGINILLIMGYSYGCYLFTHKKFFNIDNSIFLLFWILILSTLSSLLCNSLNNDAIGLDSITGSFSDCLKLKHVVLIVGNGAGLISPGAYNNITDDVPMLVLLILLLLVYSYLLIRKNRKESAIVNTPVNVVKKV